MNCLEITTLGFMVSRLPSEIDALAIQAGLRRHPITQRYVIFQTDKQVFLLIVSTASSKQQPSYCSDDLGYPLMAVCGINSDKISKESLIGLPVKIAVRN